MTSKTEQSFAAAHIEDRGTFDLFQESLKEEVAMPSLQEAPPRQGGFLGLGRGGRLGAAAGGPADERTMSRVGAIRLFRASRGSLCIPARTNW